MTAAIDSRHRRPGSARGVVLWLWAPFAGALVLSGCSGPVQVDAPQLAPPEVSACQEVLGDLPATLAGEDRREVEPDGALGAAYGDPAIVVTCVLSPPAGFDDLSRCEQVNDQVGWYVPEEQVADPAADAVLTAMTHRPFVQVELPADYRPEGAASVFAELAGPIADNLPQVDECL